MAYPRKYPVNTRQKNGLLVLEHTKGGYKYKCHCGNKKISGTDSFGSLKSCGCSRAKPRTHGKTYHPLYRRWQSMKTRCYNKKNKTYRDYGAKGIKICKRWHRFELFYKDMKGAFTPDKSLDRINPTGDYSPQNCRWATTETQNRNRKGAFLVEYKGQTIHLKDLCELHNADYQKVRQRIRKLGWSVERAVLS